MDRFLREYQEIVELGNAIQSDLRLDQICESFCREVFRIVPPAAVGTIVLYANNEEAAEYEPLLVWRSGAVSRASAPVPFGRWPHADWARERNRNLFVADAGTAGLERSSESSDAAEGHPFGRPRSMVQVLLRRRGRVIGGLLVQHETAARSYSAFQYRLLQMLADQVAVALDHAQSMERLEARSQTDALTGALNRRAFEEAIAREMRRASRPSCVKQTSFLMIDVDDFKLVNDRRGHMAGDYVLREVATRVRARLRVEDVLGRFGGDEFGLLLPETNVAGAECVAAKVLKAVREGEFEYDGEPFLVTVSVGMATDPGEPAMFVRQPTDEDKSELARRFAARTANLIRCADTALYRAKGAGKDRAEAFDDAGFDVVADPQVVLR